MDIFKNRKFKWVYHNAKFDLAVLRTFFGYPLPDPHWDTMLAAYLFDQDEEHSLKFQYNKYMSPYLHIIYLSFTKRPIRLHAASRKVAHKCNS